MGRGREAVTRARAGALGPARSTACRRPCAAPATTAPRCASAWRTSASAPSTAATRPNSPTTCSRPRFDRWGVVGINIRPPALAGTPRAGRTASTPASCRVGRPERGARHRLHRCGSSTARTARRRRSRVLAAPEIDVVTITVTEKGYCHRPADGALDADASRHRPRPRQPRGAAQPAGPARAGARPAQAVARPAVTLRQLRQHPRQRRDPRRRRARARRAARRRPRRLDRRERRLPLDHGRPHRPGDHAGRPRGASSATTAIATRAVVGRRAVPPVGDRGPLRRPRAALGPRRRAASSTT